MKYEYHVVDALGHDGDNHAAVISSHRTAKAAINAARKYNRSSDFHKVVAVAAGIPTIRFSPWGSWYFSSDYAYANRLAQQEAAK